MISIKELINIPYRCIQETFDYEYYNFFLILQDYNLYLQWQSMVQISASRQGLPVRIQIYLAYKDEG